MKNLGSWISSPLKVLTQLSFHQWLFQCLICLWVLYELLVNALVRTNRSDQQAFSSVCYIHVFLQVVLFRAFLKKQNKNQKTQTLYFIFFFPDWYFINKAIVNHWIFEQIKWKWYLSLFECTLDIKLTGSNRFQLFCLKYVHSPAKHCFAVSVLLIP